MADKIEWGAGTPGPFLSDGTTIYALDETGICNRFSARVEGGWEYRGFSHIRTAEAELEGNARLFREGPAMVQALRKADWFLTGFNGASDILDETVVPALVEIRAILARIDGEG